MITGCEKYFKKIMKQMEFKMTSFPTLTVQEYATMFVAKEDWLYMTLVELGSDFLRGKSVAVIGSMSPWVESIALAFGNLRFLLVCSCNRIFALLL